MTTTNARRISKLIVALTLATAALTTLILALSIQSARAQTPILVDKQLGRANSTVYVGEYLTFTIRIVNNTAFTITELPLSDTFNADVLSFVDATPVMPDSEDPVTGELDWDDLTTFFGDQAPGQIIDIVVGFIAEHPEPVVVNAAQVQDAHFSDGSLGSATSVHTETESVGGSSPVDKELMAGLNPQVGQPLTFTITISNNGFTTMTLAPLVDIYNPAWMAFSYAVPPPDMVDQAAGILTWLDLTAQLDDIPPHGALRVTTVFTAMASAANMSNQAVVSGAVDYLGNELGGGVDNVPINIIPVSATAIPTATPVPTARPTQQPAPTSTPAPASTSTPAPAPTSTPAPAPTSATELTPTPTLVPMSTVMVPLLPATGQKETEMMTDILWVILLVLGAGVAALARKRRSVLGRD
ncbi:MAG: hypothetical protein GY832_40695 [Chloroflexi bacterium]|nr:hypothetical protein [Chloroflexota bacterium]